MKYIKILLVLCSTLTQSTNTSVVPFTEDPYALQAPQKIVEIAEKAAAFVEFDSTYEVAIPKKAGIQINPWNKFIAYGINTKTKNPFIIINPSWFASIPQDQQLFLLARCFTVFKEGKPFSIKVVPYLFILLRILFILLLIWLLGKTLLSRHKKWVRIAIAWGIVYLCNSFVINNLQLKFTRYMNSRYDIHILNMAIQKTGNKDAAIKALQQFDTSIKEALKNGETFFTPYATLFENYANALEILP